MPVLPMHLHAVNFGGHNKISGVSLTIIGCVLRGVGGLAVRSKRGDISVAIGITTGHHLHNPCCLLLLPEGSPTLQSGGQDQKWPTSGPAGYITPTAWGVPNA